MEMDYRKQQLSERNEKAQQKILYEDHKLEAWRLDPVIRPFQISSMKQISLALLNKNIKNIRLL